MYDRPIAILDEPTVGLDPVSMISLKNFLKKEREQGKLILITTHMMDFAESLASEIVFLLEGNIYFNGSVQQLFIQTMAKTMEQAVAHLLEPKMHV
jgi:Cu-processing system ATP-binding protein